ncbi:MAG: hypothetical protein LQ340_007668, partial [Diploschistes diacapsis]
NGDGAVKPAAAGSKQDTQANTTPNSNAEAEAEEQAERDKRVRKLKKKLREARELQERKERGAVLLHEQFEKVIRISELVRDLEKLGVGPEGESREWSG